MFLWVLLIFNRIGLIISGGDFAFPCLTPNKVKGVCVSLFSCPVLQRSMATLEPSAIDFVRNSVCQEWARNDLKVCCAETENSVHMSPNSILLNNSQQVCNGNGNSNGNANGNSNGSGGVTGSNVTKLVQSTTQKPMNESHRDYVIRKLLPTIRYCGLQHVDDRFYNDTETALDEFPWLVHFIYFEEEEDGEDLLEYADRCNGVLISRRYVLSSEYCAKNPKKVRLGQYNTNRTVSCVDNPDFPECTEPTLEMKIEEEIHRSDGQNSWYDFVLYRLARGVTYTDFIRPICLPFLDPRKLVTHENLTFSGWGANDQRGVAKKRLIFDLTDVEECYKLDEELKELSANSSLICLAPQEGSEVSICVGDEGSPLMYSYKHQWFVEAIVAQVFIIVTDDNNYCSNKKPVDGIRITPEVAEWILQTIRD